MSIVKQSLIGASGQGGYFLDNSVRLRSSAGAYFDRTFDTPTDGKTWTFSCWLKRGELDVFSTAAGATQLFVTEGSGAQGFIGFGSGQNGDFGFGYSGYTRRRSAAVFRDVSAWYHIVVVVDTTEASEPDRAKLYVNGVQQTWTTITSIGLNDTTQINQAVKHDIFKQAGQSWEAMDGYLSEVNFIDGQALDVTDLGEFDGVTGVWKPKEYLGTYGTNGFHLPFKPTNQADGFNSVLYTGTGASQSVSGLGFTPDLLWFKKRSGAENHGLFDSVRGPNYFNVSNQNAAEYARGNSLTSFDTDGFSIGDYSNLSASGGTNVVWGWDAGANQATTGISSVIYEGTGAARQVTGFGFSPDLVWIKRRSTTSTNHEIYDSVRGPLTYLLPDSTTAENTNTGGVTSFDSDGFSTGDSTGSSVNVNGADLIAWGWDAGDGDPVSNTDGDIPSTVKANDANGFSIVSYTGDGNTGGVGSTVGHGLSTAPKVIIYKNRDSGTLNWMVTTTAIDGSVDFTFLNTTTSFGKTDSTENAPTSSVVSVAYNHNNTSGNDIIAYCFAEVAGVSSFGSYSGTGTTGNAITGLGFKPGFLIIKRTDATAAEWIMVDSTRDPFNPANHILSCSDALSETDYGTTNRNIDFDSDGFTIQSTSGGGTTALNASGGTYMYMAFKGSYSDYIAPLNTTGTIPARVKANTEKGFSIVSYEGVVNGTVGHGLSSAPKVIIHKDRDNSVYWRFFHYLMSGSEDYDPADNLYLSSRSSYPPGIGAATRISDVTSTTFENTGGFSGSKQIAYCWTDVAGYSKFGSYTGTGSLNNSVTTGFRPAWLLIKKVTGADQSWRIWDATRNESNPRNSLLWPDLSDAEGTNTVYNIDFDDNGFTLQHTSSGSNDSGQTYIYMAFADTREEYFNFDDSGNKNNWTPNNINANSTSEHTYDIMTDVPTLTDEDTANYCTLVPYTFRTSHSAPFTLADGNLKATPITSTFGGVVASMSPSSGKFYWEITFPVVVSASTGYGLCTPSDLQAASFSNSVYYTRGSGGTITSGGSTVASSVGVPAAGDVMSASWDVDANQITFRLNNSVLGTGAYSVPTNNRNESLLPFIYLAATTNYAYANFGQRPFKYTPPTGFKKLNAYNFADSAISDGSKYMNTVLYTGDGTAIGSGGNSITGVGFQPDWVWIKARNFAANHCVTDAVRGVTKTLFPDGTFAESTLTEGVASFDSDGFTVGNNASMNDNTDSFASWHWKANGSGTSVSVGSIDGTNPTVASTVSTNTTAGFSIATWTASGTTGDTVAHGLSTTPEAWIVKDRDRTDNWIFFHTAYDGSVDYGILDATNSTFNTSDGLISSDQWTLPTSGATNTSGSNIIGYFFHSVEGYSKIGTYTGNGLVDGPFQYLGFRPSWIMFKRVDNISNWVIYDTQRDPYNVSFHTLLPDVTNAEGTSSGGNIDLLSNGFKFRERLTAGNGTTGTYFYMAFAENPFKNSLAR